MYKNVKELSASLMKLDMLALLISMEKPLQVI